MSAGRPGQCSRRTLRRNTGHTSSAHSVMTMSIPAVSMVSTNVPVRPPGRWGHAPPASGEASAKAAIEASTARNASQTSLCEAYRATIAAKVDKGVCAKVIWEELDGFTGGYASVKLTCSRNSGPPAAPEVRDAQEQEQIVRALRDSDASSVGEVAKKLGVSEQTIYAWQRSYAARPSTT